MTPIAELPAKRYVPRMAEDGRTLSGTIFAIALAVLTAGSAPWWWPGKSKSPSENVLRADLNRAQPAPVPRQQEGSLDSTRRPPESPSEVMYRAVIGPHDHCSSNGALLRDAASVVRQDRANYYSGKQDSADEPSAEFDTFEERTGMTARLQIDPVAATTILSRNPSIVVSQNGSHLKVEVQGNGDPFVSCQP